MSCINVTALLQRVYPASLTALQAAAGGTRGGQNFVSGLIDVAYFFDSIRGSPDALNRLLRFGFQMGASTGGRAVRRIPNEVINVIDDLDAIWGHISPAAWRALIEDMARQYTKFRGGVGVLRFLRQRGYSSIAGLEIVASSTRRIYDVVLDTGRHVAIEVKNWAEFATASRSQWASAGRQMARDLAGASGRPGGTEVVWIFFTELETASRTARRGGSELRREILENLFDGIGVSLFRNHRRRMTPAEVIRRLSRINERNLSRSGTELLDSLLQMPGGVAANRDRLIQALRDMHLRSERFIFINPS